MEFSQKQVAAVLKMITAETLPAVHLTANQIKEYLKKHSNQKQQFGQRVLYSKKENIGKKGFIINDQSTLLKIANNYTHWSSNSYFGLNKDELNTSDKRIKSVKNIVIDIDCKDYYDAIYNWETQIKGNLDINEYIKPTYVVLTDKGLQVGYVFKKPIFIGKNYGKQLYSINQIYQNIVNVLKSRFNDVLIDSKNTAFGIQRLPNQSNLIAIDLDNLIEFPKAIEWSMNQSGVVLTGLKKNKKFVPKVIFGGQNRQIDNDWYIKMTADDQLHKVCRQGARNTLFTTLSLANKNSDIAQIDCENEMQKFNSKIAYPLRTQSITKIVSSIYRGRCKGAKNVYINQIIETYGLDIALRSETEGTQIHQKLDREHRKNIHANEHVDDLVSYMIELESNKHVFSTKELANALNLKQSSIHKRLIKSLKEDPRIGLEKVGRHYRIRVRKSNPIKLRESKAQG